MLVRLEFCLIGLYSICISKIDLLPIGTSNKEKSIEDLLDLFDIIIYTYI